MDPQSATAPRLPTGRETTVGVVGLGYVGLPLAIETVRSGIRVLGLDVSERVVALVTAGESHVQDVSAVEVSGAVAAGLLEATTDPARLAECDAISICVPTPLNKIKDPDLSFVVAAARAIAATLRKGQLVVLESTTYPGTTREVVLPILEESGLRAGEDFHLCFSPERVDPGNALWKTRNTPKVLGGVTPRCLAAGIDLYGRIFDRLVPVSSAEAAELTKVYENTFRMINIALANELAQACSLLDIDVWEVIEAAATKPFGFMRFEPGPGLGGHCIPLDPHYLAWKMKTLSFKTRLIELASEINAEMPAFVVGKVSAALNHERKALRGSRIRLVGIAYKRNSDDLRESPAIEIIRLLQEAGAEVSYHDPYCAEIRDDGHTPLRDLPLASVPLWLDLDELDAVVVVTDHAGVDYGMLGARARLVVDTRGVMRHHRSTARVVGISGHQTTPDRELAIAAG